MATARIGRLRTRSVLALVGAVVLVLLSPARLIAMTTSDAARLYGYPYPNAPDCNEQTGASCVGDQWGFVQGQCHSWVAYRLNELNGGALRGAKFNDWYRQPSGQEWGSTWHWGIAAAAAGITVNDTPTLGSVAWWSNDGGHVGYVEAINPDGSVQMSEMNFDLHNGFDFATLQRGQRWPTGFIHIADRGASAPGAPTAAHASPGNGNATVNWVAPASHGAAITAYVVTPYVGYVPQAARTYNSTATMQVVTGLTNAKTYRFKVEAKNSVGTGPPSAATGAVIAGAPTPPSSVSAAARSHGALVHWAAPATNSGSAITAYVVTPYVNGSGLPARVFTSTATSQTVTGLTPGTSYTFSVAAKNARGVSPQSRASNSVKPT